MRKLAEKTGAALLTVLIAMMIISLMLFEFQYNAMIERKLAYNDLNQLQAYYLAKAGAKMGLLRIALYGRLRASKDIQSFKQKGFDPTPLLDQIWQLPLPAFPPSGEKNDKLLKADQDAAQKILKETKVSDGRYTETITSESSKINLNLLQIKDQNTRPDFRSSPSTPQTYVAMMLINFLDNLIQQSENPTAEYDNMKPEDIVTHIIDWISPGTTSFGGGGKDAFYEVQKPPYKSKKGLFFTVDELKMVQGIDDHLFEKLKPAVTVYSDDGKININSAGKDVYKALYKDFTDDDVKRILNERGRRGGSWPDEKTFVDFVTNDLNRSAFGTLYGNTNGKQYPFTVGSLSFMIESLGQIDKSKSSIQKVIRVGVALTRGKGGQVTQETNIQTCNGQDPNTSPTYWDYRFNKCLTKPTSASECQNITGTWQDGPPQGCIVMNVAPGAPAQSMTLRPPGATPGANGAPATTAPPNSMKIMYWSES